jgi:predicted XRE-type DNA-binding protein
MFYTRSESPSTMSAHSSKMNITELPTEVLVVIFRNCSYREVAERLRPVCRRFSHVAALVLNSELSTLGKRICRSMDVVEQHMMQTQTVPQFLTLSQIFNVLEIVRSRVSSLSESSLRLLFSMSKLHVLVITAIKHTFLCHKFSVLQILCC